MRFELDHLSSRELDALIAAAEKRKSALVSVQPVQPKGRVKQPRKNRAQVAAKYRDPENAKNTWSGRGSTPRWLAEKVRRGMSAADFLIPGLARPTARRGGEIGRKSVFKQEV